MVKLKPYPAYKDSGVEWLGKVPAHWSVLPNRSLFAEIIDRNHPDEEMLSVTIAKGVIRQRSLLADGFKKDSSNQDKTAYKLVLPGDIVYNKMRAWQGATGASGFRGIVSPAYVVARPLGDLDTRYYHYLLRTPNFAKEAERWSYGITSDQWSLRPEHFKMVYSALPPKDEQAAMVRFLDHVDSRVRQITRAKQKQITLLNEQKYTIIHTLITRGLDPEVRLKPSGLEWLGDVPAHWLPTRLKDVAIVQTGMTLGKNYKDIPTESRPYLRVANVQQGRIDLNEVKYIEIPLAEAAGVTLKAGDVLMTEGGDIDKLGRGCVWYDEIPGCLHQNHVFAVRCRADALLPEFLVGLMASQHGRAYFQLTAKQTTNLASTNSSTLRAFPIMLPPVAEQAEILAAISNRTSGINTAISRYEREIALVGEYRTRLIAEVVTGKLDVREAAANLPEELETLHTEDLDTEEEAEDLEEETQEPEEA